MGYIKPKKVWRKRFSKGEISLIWGIFMKYAPINHDDWEKTTFKKVQKSQGNFIHPETDIEDNSEGLQPKQVKKFLENYSLEEFEYVLAMLSIANERSALNNYLSDGFISWKNIWEQYVEPIFYSEEQKGSTFYKLGVLLMRLFPDIFGRYKTVSKNVLESLGSMEISLDDIEQAVKNGIITRNSKILSLDMLNTKAFFEKRGDLWKKERGFCPKSEFMLRVNPDNFYKSLLETIFKMYQVRQIGKLEPKDQRSVALLIDNFGINMEVIPVEIMKNANIGSFEFGNEKIPDFRKELVKFFKDIPIEKHSIKTTKEMLWTWSKSEHFRTFIMRKDKLTESDFTLMNFINGVLMQLENHSEKEKLMKTIENITPDMWKSFYRYNVRDPQQIICLFDLFEKNKGNKHDVPVFKGKVGSYTYEFIPKNDPRGLVLGYATDCCQVIGGQGQACLESGFRHENSGFFVVEKNGHIYAQSWVWTKDTKKGKSLCFDSVEVLGKNLDKSKDILGCYVEASKLLVSDYKYKFVYAGADGNTMPKGLEKAGQFIDPNEMATLNLYSPFNHYSDVEHGVISLAEKTDKKS